MSPIKTTVLPLGSLPQHHEHLKGKLRTRALPEKQGDAEINAGALFGDSFLCESGKRWLTELQMK
jgi:hypothetical protein